MLALWYLRSFSSGTVKHSASMLTAALRIFEEAGLRYVRGFQPPAWDCAPVLQEACRDVGIEWITSARDVQTPVSERARTAMSGLKGVSMLFPERIAERLLHISTNFQATSAPERAFHILDAGGVLSIKAHITKNVPGHTHLDGVDDLYMHYLYCLFFDIEERYGDARIIDNFRSSGSDIVGLVLNIAAREVPRWYPLRIEPRN